MNAISMVLEEEWKNKELNHDAMLHLYCYTLRLYHLNKWFNLPIWSKRELSLRTSFLHNYKSSIRQGERSLVRRLDRNFMISSSQKLAIGESSSLRKSNYSKVSPWQTLLLTKRSMLSSSKVSPRTILIKNPHLWPGWKRERVPLCQPLR